MRSCLAVVSVLLAASTGAGAETMFVAGFGGSFETAFRDKIIPPFQDRTGAQINYVPGNSTDTLARLQAQKDRPEISVALIDDGPMATAVEFGLCAPIAEGENSRNVYPNAQSRDGRTIGLGYNATGIVYNTEVFERNGWAAPTSWKDLEDPKFEGSIVIPPIGNGFGLLALVMEARLNGGSESQIDPGFGAMKRISPNVLVFEPNPGKIAELLQTGEAALGVWGSGRARSLVAQGAPVKFVYPSEGAPVILSQICAVEKGPQSGLAQDFIQYLLSPEVQAILTEATGVGPVNKNTQLSAELAADPIIVYGEDKVKSLVSVDYTVINPARGAWTDRWNREIER